MRDSAEKTRRADKDAEAPALPEEVAAAASGPGHRAALRAAHSRAAGSLPPASVDAAPEAPGSAVPADLGRGQAHGDGMRVLGHSGEDRNAIASMGAFSPLGTMGPLGYLGPLGQYGPVGDKSWNPSSMISGGAGWEGTSDRLAESGGPRGAGGVLSDRSMVGVDWYNGGVLPALQPGGSTGVLGPAGPLGPLGLVGPLGPVGVHGHHADQDGNYLGPDGKVVRQMDARYDAQGSRTWDLYERYTEERAKGMKDNDTSFAVDGTVSKQKEVDDYPFQVASPQIITVAVTPLDNADNFDLAVRDRKDKKVAQSQSGSEVSWTQFVANPGAYKAQISLSELSKSLRRIGGEDRPGRYRLTVTGTQSMAIGGDTADALLPR